MNLLVLGLLSSILMLDPASTSAKEPAVGRETPDWRLVLRGVFAVRENPFGVDWQLQLGAQRGLYAHPSPLLHKNHLLLGIDAKVNPIAAKVGPSFEIQPLSVAAIRVRAEWVGYWGTLGFLQSFQSPVENYSDSTLSRRQDDNLNYSTTGVHTAIEPLLQFGLPVGPARDGHQRMGFIALRDRLSVEYWNVSTHSPTGSGGRKDTVFYDPTLDTLVPAIGWILQNDLDLVFQSKPKLTVGIRYTAVHPIYDYASFRNSAEADSYKNDNDVHRLGPLVAYSFVGGNESDRNSLTLLLLINWYLGHRWRTGQDVSTAIPYVLLGLSFHHDLFHVVD